MRNKNIVMDKKINLRQWQKECFEKVKKVWKSGRHSFLAVAGVGSGKTMFSAYVFNYFFRVLSTFDSVIVVSPTENIKRNWSAKFQENFEIKVDHGYQFKYGWPRDCNGISITYQSLTNQNLKTLKNYVNKRVMLVVDEVHHAGNDKSWGDAINEIGKLSGFVLMLSGTPSRNDNEGIPFVTYRKISEKKYQLQSDFTYGYAESVKSKICCPVIFQRNESTAKTLSGEKRLKNEDATPEIKKLYNDIISVKEKGDCYVYQTFLKANDKLNHINELRNENYAGLIVCNSKQDAKILHKRIYKSFGDGFVELVTSDDRGASEKIQDFQNSYKSWIISINMVSEGVDIPRIRAIVYASNVTTMVRFVQVMGRGIRNPNHVENFADECYMYIPEYKPLIENAKSIEKEIRHIRLEIEKELDKPKIKSRGDEVQINIDEIVLSATSESSGSVFKGNLFSHSEDLDAATMSKKYGVTKSIVLHMWSDILKSANNHPNGFIPPNERAKKLNTITEEKEQFKRLIQKAVAKIHYDYGIEFKEIHFKLNSSMGKKNSLNLTLLEYKKKLELAIELYEKLEKSNK